MEKSDCKTCEYGAECAGIQVKAWLLKQAYDVGLENARPLIDDRLILLYNSAGDEVSPDDFNDNDESLGHRWCASPLGLFILACHFPEWYRAKSFVAQSRN